MQPIKDPAGTFAFSVPDDWEPTRVEAGDVCVDGPGHCSNVIVLAQAKQAASLDEQVKGTRTALQHAMPSWTATEEEPREVSGHPGHLIRSVNEMAGIQMLGMHLLAFTDKHEVTMSVSYPTGDAETLEPAAAQIVESLHLAPAAQSPETSPT